ncbi:MAG: hypothetical protein MUC66_05110 [Methanolinea sp.]|jgi:hypothetical protein|nr:hypothetical protein [Methanolinea sp.]
MVVNSLKRALVLLSKNPFLWLPGLVTGVLGALDLILQYSFGTFLATRLWFLEALLIPFLLAGAYTQIRSGEGDASAYLAGGMAYYFRILLPSLVIAFAVLATVFLVAIPLAIMGTIGAVLPFVIMGCTIPLIFFTFFFDTAAVFEDRRVFDCIRRSVEVVLNRPGRVVGFFLASFGIVFLVAIPLAIIWTSLLYDQLLPLVSMDPAQIQALSMPILNEMLGFQGILLTAVMYVIGVTLAGNIIYTFKAVFYQETCQGPSQVTPEILQGEFDEKGRWYKY